MNNQSILHIKKLDFWTDNVLEIIWKELATESRQNSYNIYIQKKYEQDRNELGISLSLKYLNQN